MPIPWSLSAHPLVPECPLDGQDNLMVSDRTAYVILFSINVVVAKQVTLVKVQ